MTPESLLIKYALAVGIGALIGVERDSNLRNEQEITEYRKRAEISAEKFSFINKGVPAKNIGGLRTYILIATLGSFAGMAASNGLQGMLWLITAGMLAFVLMLFFLNYFDKNTFGLTTEISVLLNYSASVLIFATDIPVTVITSISIVAVLVLGLKYKLHAWVSKFSKDELVDTTKFIIFTMVILPFLPNQNFSPAEIPFFGAFFDTFMSGELLKHLEIFNPLRIWSIVILVMSLNYIGYFVTKLVKSKAGINLLAVLGGMVSSTAVTEAMAIQSMKTKSLVATNRLIVATLLANVTQFIRTFLIALLLNVHLGIQIGLPILFMSLFFTFWFFRIDKKVAAPSSVANVDMGIDFKSPFSLVPALAFGLLFLSVEVISKLVLYFVGDSGLMISSLIVSLTGIDPVTISISALAGSDISYEFGALIMVIGMCGNLLMKLMFAIISGSKDFRDGVAKVFIGNIFIGLFSILLIILT